MALVITLILLSVTLIMAVAFLSISRRERDAVTTTTDTASARLAADAALAHAEAQIVANIFASSNAAAYNFGLLVSTNFFNTSAFNVAVGANPTNVNYDSSGLTPDQRNQAIANLFYSARAPVNLTNMVFRTMENRFYLDLNRNGRFDTNGWVTNVDNLNNGLGTTNFEVGDPEWIGVLDHPDVPHGPNNRFVARYAFIAVPVGNTLDINAIYNQVFDEPTAAPSSGTTISVNPGATINDGFFRNQGVGSWEINLAAFLADLNTTEWGQVVGSGPGAPVGSANYYQYNEPFNRTDNQGRAFDDARALLAYRYANNYNSLATVLGLYGGPLALSGPGPVAFINDGIDGYSDGPLQTTFNTNEFFFADNPQLPWAGADNTNQFFTHQELFDTNKTGIGATTNGFTYHLLNAGTNVSTYNRYTFYRMLDELGSDSAPESGKININYSNAIVRTDFNGLVTNMTIVPHAETNFMAWTPTNFFIAAADHLLRAYTTNWFTGSSFNIFTNYTTVTNLIYTDPSNYLATYYGLHTNYFSYIDGQGNYIWNAPNGFGLTNIPFFGMANQIPAFGITNIPVWVNGHFVYSPAVNRLLQLAANIYDATTNSFYPHVFRPTFWVTNEFGFTNIFIRGYQEVVSVTGVNDFQLSQPVDVTSLLLGASTANYINGVNVYGVPWIIGAKKSFPNFNEFALENTFALSRRLQLTRTIPANVTYGQTLPITGTNQMYMMNINCSLGLDFWNSYNSNYSGTVTVVYRGADSIMLTNDDTGFNSHPGFVEPMVLGFGGTNTFSGWHGSAPWVNNYPYFGSFFTPLNVTNIFIMTNSVYRSPFASGSAVPPGFTAPCLIPTNYFNIVLGTPLVFETATPGFPFPHFGTTTTNQLQVFMLDYSNNIYHVIDYAHFEQVKFRDLDAEIFTDDSDGIVRGGVWNTNINSKTGIPYGIENQLIISRGIAPYNGTPPPEDGLWNSDPEASVLGGTPTQQQHSFDAFFLPFGSQETYVENGVRRQASNVLASVEAPYSPVRYGVSYTVWQANDPLVHYLSSDLTPSISFNVSNQFNSVAQVPTLANFNLGALNKNYQPWGGSHYQHPPDSRDSDPAVKDPLIQQSDNWNFPTNKFPTVGWMGRVHRGTPWQTIYLKASDVLAPANGINTWITWTGNFNTNDAANSVPKKDWLLFDLFTTAFNDNATRGQLSVNVAADNPDPMAGLAAWSALLSGVVVPTNLVGGYTIINPAGPAGTNSPLGQIVNGIFQMRTNFTNPDGVKGVFEHIGYILSVPQLTEQSPFTNGVQRNDEMYEWLPQQVMSLLHASPPRYVIYCYGQALKPAPDSLVTAGGANFGICTNYQVVAESAARAVVRVEGAGTSAPHVVVESINPLPPD